MVAANYHLPPLPPVPSLKKQSFVSNEGAPTNEDSLGLPKPPINAK